MPTIDSALEYLVSVFLISCEQLLLLVGPLLAIAFVMQLVNGAIRKRYGALFGANTYNIITAPGVICHELGHAFFCLLFAHQINQLKLFQLNGGHSLGYVTHSFNKKSLYQSLGNFFIGTGPIWFGSAMLVVITLLLVPALHASIAANSRLALVGQLDWQHLLQDASTYLDAVQGALLALLDSDQFSQWQFWLWLYLSLAIGSHITLSKSDLQNTGKGLLLFLVVVYLINLVLLIARGSNTVMGSNILSAGLHLGATLLGMILVVNVILLIILSISAALLRTR